MTNDGVRFKLQCDVTGQFIRREWQLCRERKVCSKTAPIPDYKTGLWVTDSVDVPEFDFAVYQVRSNYLDRCVNDPNETIKSLRMDKLLVSIISITYHIIHIS